MLASISVSSGVRAAIVDVTTRVGPRRGDTVMARRRTVVKHWAMFLITFTVVLVLLGQVAAQLFSGKAEVFEHADQAGSIVGGNRWNWIAPPSVDSALVDRTVRGRRESRGQFRQRPAHRAGAGGEQRGEEQVVS